MSNDTDGQSPEAAAILAQLGLMAKGGGGAGPVGGKATTAIPVPTSADADGDTLVPAVDVDDLSPGEWRELWHFGERLRANWRSEQTIPACWVVHHSMATEILGLVLAWDDVLSGSTTLGTWCHALDLALSRIERRWASTCGAGHHLPDQPASTDETWLAERLSSGEQTPADGAA